MSVFVSLSFRTHISEITLHQTSPNYVCTLSVALARFSSGGVATQGIVDDVIIIIIIYLLKENSTNVDNV